MLIMKEKDKTKAQLRTEVAAMEKRFAELKEREHEIRKAEKKLQEELVEHEKISALGRLTANVAHEIRNPITAIGGLARRLKKSASLKTYENEYLDLIIQEARRLEDVLKEVISFTGRRTYHREEYIINDLVDENLITFESVFKEHSVTVVKSLSEVPSVYVDKTAFMGAMRHLLSNAIDAMPDGGKLTITTGLDTSDETHYVFLKVSDTGVGIPEENIALIFEPFFTTKVTKKETGLGLSITRKYIKDLGGFIRVSSVAGRGTTFGIYLPYRSISSDAKGEKQG
jgi:signal transduction histidine kinase